MCATFARLPDLFFLRQAAKPAAKKVKAAKPAGEKKAPNAYMKFSNANRDAVKAKNPTAKITDLSKVRLGAAWQT